MEEDIWKKLQRDGTNTFTQPRTLQFIDCISLGAHLVNILMDPSSAYSTFDIDVSPISHDQPLTRVVSNMTEYDLIIPTYNWIW